MTRTWHVYAILGHDPGEVRLQGLGGAKVQAIRGGGVYALASERAGGSINASDPLEHHRVIERALERWPLLPARFAAPISQETLIHRLEHDAGAHLAALERVRDSREFAIRAELDEAVAPHVNPGIQSGRAYLEARRDEWRALETANARLVEFSERLSQHLAPFALEFTHRYPEPNLTGARRWWRAVVSRLSGTRSRPHSSACLPRASGHRCTGHTRRIHLFILVNSVQKEERHERPDRVAQAGDGPGRRAPARPAEIARADREGPRTRGHRGPRHREGRASPARLSIAGPQGARAARAS